VILGLFVVLMILAPIGKLVHLGQSVGDDS
jgi:hypothetical protein